MNGWEGMTWMTICTLRKSHRTVQDDTALTTVTRTLPWSYNSRLHAIINTFSVWNMQYRWKNTKNFTLLFLLFIIFFLRDKSHTLSHITLPPLSLPSLPSHYHPSSLTTLPPYCDLRSITGWAKCRESRRMDDDAYDHGCMCVSYWCGREEMWTLHPWGQMQRRVRWNSAQPASSNFLHSEPASVIRERDRQTDAVLLTTYMISEWICNTATPLEHQTIFCLFLFFFYYNYYFHPSLRAWYLHLVKQDQ